MFLTLTKISIFRTCKELSMTLKKPPQKKQNLFKTDDIATLFWCLWVNFNLWTLHLQQRIDNDNISNMSVPHKILNISFIRLMVVILNREAEKTKTKNQHKKEMKNTPKKKNTLKNKNKCVIISFQNWYSTHAQIYECNGKNKNEYTLLKTEIRIFWRMFWICYNKDNKSKDHNNNNTNLYIPLKTSLS